MNEAQGMAVCRLPACGQRFVSGMSNRYRSEYPDALRGVVRESDFVSVMAELNDMASTYWPCPFCFAFGWGCCLCTAGLSLLCPNMCVSEAERYVDRQLHYINGRKMFVDAGVSWRLAKCCGRSAIEVHYPSHDAAASPAVPQAAPAGGYNTGSTSAAAVAPVAVEQPQGSA